MDPVFPLPETLWLVSLRNMILISYFVFATLLVCQHIKRRMAPLSAALAGVVLPHDHFGSHLDDSGNTIDTDLERKNLKKLGKYCVISGTIYLLITTL